MFIQPPLPYSQWIARLDPLLPLVKAQIPLIIWGEDALCVLKRVDTCQTLLQIVVSDTFVHEAASKIEGYSAIDPQSLRAWHEPRINHPESPFAFPGSLVLESQASKSTSSMSIPSHIFVHPASTVHIDMDDQTRSLALSMLPNDDPKRNIRFLTLPALYDSLVDTIFDPPHDFRHYILGISLNFLLGELCETIAVDDLNEANDRNHGTNLDDSTGSDAGVDSDDGAGSEHDGYNSDSDDDTYDLEGGKGAGLSNLVNRCVDEKGDLLPLFTNVLQSVKEENRPILNREFRKAEKPSWDDAGMERLLLKTARL